MSVSSIGSGSAYVTDFQVTAPSADLVQVLTITAPPKVNLSDPFDASKALRGQMVLKLSTSSMFRTDGSSLPSEIVTSDPIGLAYPGSVSLENPDVPGGRSVEAVVRMALDSLIAAVPQGGLQAEL